VSRTRKDARPRLIKAKPGDHFSWTDLQQSFSHPDRRMTLCAGVASDVRYWPEADIVSTLHISAYEGIADMPFLERKCPLLNPKLT